MIRILVIDVEDGLHYLLLCQKKSVQSTLSGLLLHQCIGKVLPDNQPHPNLKSVHIL